jgi:hypothetical protein
MICLAAPAAARLPMLTPALLPDRPRSFDTRRARLRLVDLAIGPLARFPALSGCAHAVSAACLPALLRLGSGSFDVSLLTLGLLQLSFPRLHRCAKHCGQVCGALCLEPRTESRTTNSGRGRLTPLAASPSGLPVGSLPSAISALLRSAALPVSPLSSQSLMVSKSS